MCKSPLLHLRRTLSSTWMMPSEDRTTLRSSWPWLSAEPTWCRLRLKSWGHRWNRQRGAGEWQSKSFWTPVSVCSSCTHRWGLGLWLSKCTPWSWRPLQRISLFNSKEEPWLGSLPGVQKMYSSKYALGSSRFTNTLIGWLNHVNLK